MKKTIKHYIEFYLSDKSMLSKPISKRKAPKTFPSECTCYRFFDRLIIISKSNKVTGKTENISKWIYLKK